MRRIAIIPGDGIGKEVVPEAVKVLEWANRRFGLQLRLDYFDWGADRYLRDQVSLPADALEMFRREYSAILAGAFGDPRITDNRHAGDILLGLRTGLDLYINLRPVKLLDERRSPLKGRSAREIDFVVFRENTEGPYARIGGQFKRGTGDEVAIQEDINTRRGVERIVVAAFEYARAHGRKCVTMADKSNVLTYGHELWQRAFREVATRYPDVEARHQYIDAMAMFFVTDPGRYDVIVTNNLFGDILTDLGAGLVGGLGLAASANIHPGSVSLFEPVHGSAPDIAGKGTANPMGAILSASMMLEFLDALTAAAEVEQAVAECLKADETTVELGGRLGTSGCGDAIVRRLAVR
ncbi:MAG: 3-isopropylmalate dehydrogenase [Acidobacteria bacterium]|nr:3-isopropylmalate dehydrogenase [Acidobacteriota bacterium]